MGSETNILSYDELNILSEAVMTVAQRVHRLLGSDFSERVYEQAMINEFVKENLRYENRKIIKFDYGWGSVVSRSVSFIIEDKVLVDVRNVPGMTEFYGYQMLSNLAVSGKKAGLVINFGGKELEIRTVNGGQPL